MAPESPQNLPRSLKFFLIFSLLAAFAAQLYATAVERQLFRDGASHLFGALEYHILTRDGWRYVTQVSYLAPLLLAKLTSNLTLIVASFGLYFTVLSFTSLAICFALAKEAKRVDVMCYPIMSLAAGTMLTAVFSSIGLIEVGAAFWPALFAICFFNPISKHRLALAAFLIVGLGTSHEAAVVCLPTLLVAAVLQVRRSTSSQMRLNFLSLCVLCIISIGSCIYRAKYGPYPTGGQFSEFYLSLFGRIRRDPSLAIVFSMLAVFAISIFASINWLVISVLMAGSVALPLLTFGMISINPNVAAEERPLTTLVIAIVAALMIAQFFLFEDPSALKRRRLTQALVVASLMLCLASVRDSLLSQSWKEAADYIRSQIEKEPQYCSMLSRQDLNYLTSIGADTDFMIHLSIMLQHTPSPKAVLFAESTSPVCDILLQDRLIKQVQADGTIHDFGWNLPDKGYFHFPDHQRL